MDRSGGGEAIEGKDGGPGFPRCGPDQRRTQDRPSINDELAHQSPPETRHRLRPMPGQTHPAKSCPVVPACFLDREYQSGIHPKEQSPKQSTRYQKLSFELRNSSDDKFWLSPCP
jgi:hypothetical protein